MILRIKSRILPQSEKETNSQYSATKDKHNAWRKLFDLPSQKKQDKRLNSQRRYASSNHQNEASHGIKRKIKKGSLEEAHLP